MSEKKYERGYAYVVADLLHTGHLKHLQRCASLCEFLIVGVLTDEATMEKKKRPIIPFEERLELINALRPVCLAIEQKTYSPLPNAKELCVDVLFESTSHTPEAIEEAKKVMKNVEVMPYYEAQSSTMIKNKILNVWK